MVARAIATIAAVVVVSRKVVILKANRNRKTATALHRVTESRKATVLSRKATETSKAAIAINHRETETNRHKVIVLNRRVTETNKAATETNLRAIAINHKVTGPKTKALNLQRTTTTILHNCNLYGQ